MDKTSVEDLRTMYQGTLCMFKNKPYFVEQVGHGADGTAAATCFDLAAQRQRIMAINEVDFTAPQRRLGFVNIKQSVVFLSRVPVRKYKVGVSKENTDCKLLNIQYPEGEAQTKAAVHTFKSVELSDTVFNRYPTIEEAYTLLGIGASAVAFDRQFALTREGMIFYKTEKVGSYKQKHKSSKDFKFFENYAHLTLLLDNNHEKSISNPRP